MRTPRWNSSINRKIKISEKIKSSAFEAKFGRVAKNSIKEYRAGNKAGMVKELRKLEKELI